MRSPEAGAALEVSEAAVIARFSGDFVVNEREGAEEGRGP